MRYWNFDVVQLIADYERNRKTLASILEAKRVAQGYYENPVGATSRGDWEQYLKIIELRENEYQLYVDMVIMGMNDLPEIERQVLKWWLMDNYEDSIIMDNGRILAIPSLEANNVDAMLVHEAAIGKIAGDQLTKLMTLGLTEQQAEEQIINGFLR